jgi:membrane protein YdbS with pleckstrin-like domain
MGLPISYIGGHMKTLKTIHEGIITVLMWIMGIVFGIGCFVALIWMITGIVSLIPYEVFSAIAMIYILNSLMSKCKCKED